MQFGAGSLTSLRVPSKFQAPVFLFFQKFFGSHVSVRTNRNWEAGENPALPRNCKRGNCVWPLKL